MSNLSNQTQFEDYEIEFKSKEILKSKAYYVKVYLAKKKSSNKRFIITKFRIEDKYDSELRKLLTQNEDHPHHELAFFSDFLCVDNYFFAINPLIGERLSKVLVSRKKIDTETCFVYLVQLIKAIEYLHENKIIHSFINPDDIYVDDDDNLKLGGFYFAVLVDLEDSSSINTKYLYYNYPNKLICHKYDIWCIGWVIYECFTGENAQELLDTSDFTNWESPSIEDNDLNQIFQGNQKKERNSKIGKLIKDRYKIETLLGFGIFGCVYKAFDKVDKLEKAIKFKHIETNDTVKVDEEAEILIKLEHHRNVVLYYDYFFHDLKEMCIITEYCEGGDLKQYLTSLKVKYETIPDRTLFNWTRQLLRGLQYVHSQRICHRDIKPGNILLSEDLDLLKYADFGLSKETSSTNQMLKSKKGTPNYAAPEIFFGDLYDNKVDIWSLGCVIYELVHLKVPLTTKALNHLILIKNQSLIPQLDHKHILHELVLNMLQIEPSNRKSAEELLKQFRDIQEELLSKN